MALGKLSMDKRLAEKNVKVIKAKGVDTLLLSMILGIDLQSKNRNELDNNGRVLILSTMGFIVIKTQNLLHSEKKLHRKKPL